jgi:hypothetical protein
VFIRIPATRSSVAVSVIVFMYLPSPSLLPITSRIFS